ncbi:MAG: oligosaccharyl transferase, archaeosortase A system-associated [Dehalococcoidia bacterium]|nr:oligosaccharyl transferase, archaeosortase A system-associated [Dehalococcoidia bacterium]
MTRSRLEFIVFAVLLCAIFGISLALRTGLPWEQVFTGQWIKLTDNDAYYYVRLLDNLSSHFPLLGKFDPYSIFPAGKDLSGQPLFFVYFMGFFTWLLGGGHPSQQTVDVVAVLFPAVLGALMVFPVFFIGRAVFNKWAGLAAALFITFIPGEYLARTLLGNTDIHAMEIFFSTLFMLFLLLAVNSGKDTSLHPLPQAGRRALARPIIYSAAAGLCLGIYVMSWEGALLFVLISFAWLVLQIIINHLRGRPAGYLGLAGGITYLCALLSSFAARPGLMASLSLLAALAAAAVLPLLSWYMQRRKLKPAYYIPCVLALAGLGILAVYLVSPALPGQMFSAIVKFFMWRPSVTIAEAQPLLIDRGSFTLAMTWGNFTTASVMGLIGLGIIIYQVCRNGSPGITMLAVWSIFTLLAALAMRRFAYYFAVNAALLSGYTGWLILRATGFKEDTALAPPPPASPASKKKTKTARSRAAQGGARANRALLALGGAAVVLLAVYPNTGPLPGGDRPFSDVATRALYTPSDAWYESLDWMRGNTPEPFGEPGYYYEYYQKDSSGAQPSAAYSVVCWWDNGYWVTRIAHRVPFSNPGSAQIGEQYLFTAQDPAAADKIASASGMKYVVLSDYLVDWTKGLETVAADAGQPASRYYEIYYRTQNGKLSPTLLYYPEYYQMLSVRLYCFDGKEFTPSETAVISWEAKTGADGAPYKEITGLKTFGSQADAAAFIDMQKEGNWRIVGKDPHISPVPLEALEGYRHVYSSSQKSHIGNAELPEVRIFEYTGTE